MAKRSRSIATELESFRRVGAAGTANKAKLPKEVGPVLTELAKRAAAAQKLNSDQERLKAELRKTTQALNAEIKAGVRARSRVLKAAEFVFGIGSPEMVAFRGAGEG